MIWSTVEIAKPRRGKDLADVNRAVAFMRSVNLEGSLSGVNPVSLCLAASLTLLAPLSS